MKIIDNIKRRIKRRLFNKGFYIPRGSKIEDCIVFEVDDFENWCFHRYFQDFPNATGAVEHLLDMKSLRELALYKLEYVPNKKKERVILNFQKKLISLYTTLKCCEFNGYIIIRSTQAIAGNPE